jgi:molybdopterin converting factor small subunit
MKIKFSSPLHQLAGREIEVSIGQPITLRKLIELLAEKYGDNFKNKILTKDGNIVRFVSVFVNHKMLSVNRESAIINDSDLVEFIPLVSGG